jgi:hypothetical protein
MTGFDGSEGNTPIQGRANKLVTQKGLYLNTNAI